MRSEITIVVQVRPIAHWIGVDWAGFRLVEYSFIVDPTDSSFYYVSEAEYVGEMPVREELRVVPREEQNHSQG